MVASSRPPDFEETFLFRLVTQAVIRQTRASSATLVIRFGRSASYRARVLPPRLFRATLPPFLLPILSTECGLCPMRNSSPQASHLNVPISWKRVEFSRPLFFDCYRTHVLIFRSVAICLIRAAIYSGVPFGGIGSVLWHKSYLADREQTSRV